MNGFSEYIFRVERPKVDPTVRGALRHVRTTLKQAADLHLKSTARWGLTEEQTDTERELLGLDRGPPRNALASNITAKYVVAKRAIELLDRRQQRNPQRRWFLVTLINDRWMTYDRETEIWLGGMIATARPVLQLARFDGWLANVEIQTIDESRAGIGRWLLPHVHGVGWSDDPDFDVEAAEARMCESRRLYSGIGARTAQISVWDDSRACNQFAYVEKGACIAKCRHWNGRSPSGFWLGDCALRPISAVRQNEILSQVEVTDLLFAGGDGTSLRDKLKGHLHAAMRGNNAPPLTPRDARRFWQEVRPERYRHYRDVQIHREPRLRAFADERAWVARELIDGLYAPRGADLAAQVAIAPLLVDPMLARAMRKPRAG